MFIALELRFKGCDNEQSLNKVAEKIKLTNAIDYNGFHNEKYKLLTISFSRWFKNVDWEEVYYKQLKPPIVPKVSYDGDTRNFDDYPETDWRQVPSVTDREFRMFEDF